MKGLDLSKFKKVRDDQKSTTLRHSDGHELRIAHSGLSPKMLAQLKGIQSQNGVKKYAEGGDTSSGSFSDDAKSAYRQVFGEPNEQVEPKQSGIDFASRYNQPAQSQAPVVINVGSPPADDKAASAARLGIPPQNMAAMDAIKAKEGALPSDNQPPAAKPAPAQPQASLAPQAAPQPSRQPAEVPGAQLPDDQAAPPAPGMVGQSAPAAAPALQPQQTPYQQAYTSYKQAHQKEFAEQDAAFAQDLNSGHIQPETIQSLFAKKDTLGKVGSIFGIMLGGMGSGLTGQPNAALEMMQKEIQNDLQAQMTSKTNAHNLIQLNQTQQMNDAQIANMVKTGQLTDAQAQAMHTDAKLKAFTFAQLQANRMALHNQKLMVDKMPEGPQKEQAKQALAMMGTAVTAENSNIADMAASKMALLSSMGGGQGGTLGMRLGGMDKLADDIDTKSVPGIGRGTIPVPQDIRAQMVAQKQYDEKAREYVDFAKKHAKNWANLNPVDRQKIANQGAAMGANLQGLFRMKSKGGTYKEGEQQFIEKVIPNQPAQWSASFNAIPKVEQTISDNQNDFKNTAGSVGIKVGGEASDSVSTNSAGAAKEGAASTSKSGKPIVFKNGKWHYK